jgi:hypothetical protein
VAICDSYKVYDVLARDREGSDLTLADCWARLSTGGHPAGRRGRGCNDPRSRPRVIGILREVCGCLVVTKGDNGGGFPLDLRGAHRIQIKSASRMKDLENPFNGMCEMIAEKDARTYGMLVSEKHAVADAEQLTTPCRFCGAPAERVFDLRVMHRYDVGFFRCVDCGCLETETPYWLDEAYEDQRRFFDTEVALRNQRLQEVVCFLAQELGLGPTDRLADFGGGNGLLVRMLRDAGLNAFVSDKYATNFFAPGFEDRDDEPVTMITAFEVFEHLPEPADTVAEIFARKPKYMLLTTGRYTGQGADWSYIWARTGRHVFFWSRKAMDMIAQRYSYHRHSFGSTNLFTREPLARRQRRRIKRLMSQDEVRLAVRFARSRTHRHAQADRTAMVDRNVDAPDPSDDGRRDSSATR